MTCPKPSDENSPTLANFLRQLRRRTFKADIIFLFCTVILATVLAISIFSYRRNSAAALQMTNQLVEKLTDGMIRHTTGYMKPVQGITEISAQLLADPDMHISPGSEIETYLMKILHVLPQIDFVYFGTEQGEFIQARFPKRPGPVLTRFIRKKGANRIEIIRHYDESGKFLREEPQPPPSYDPRERPWYTGSRQAGGAFWTDLYVFSSTGKPGITASFPVIDSKGRFIGAVGADISLDGLSLFLRENRISRNGLSFIMDKQRRFVAFPDPARMLKVEKGAIVPIQAVDLGEPWVTEAVRMFEDTGKRTFAFSSRGSRYLAYFTPFPAGFGKDWTIAVLAPEDDFLGPVKQAFRESLMISLLVLLAAVGIGYF
ncbi:MAG: cache domain-containing protein, partial [Syntrophales bacterium]